MPLFDKFGREVEFFDLFDDVDPISMKQVSDYIDELDIKRTVPSSPTRHELEEDDLSCTPTQIVCDLDCCTIPNNTKKVNRNYLSSSKTPTVPSYSSPRPTDRRNIYAVCSNIYFNTVSQLLI